MLLCGWTKRKNKQSTTSSSSQDRCDTSVPIEEEKQAIETSIPENITVKSEDCKDPENFSQSIPLFVFIISSIAKAMLHFI